VRARSIVARATSWPPTRYSWYHAGPVVARATIARARTAGYTALVVTIDTPVAGMRERDLRNGMKELVTRNPIKMLPFVMQFAVKPAWLVGFWGDGGLMKFPNVVIPGEGPMLYADVGTALESSVVTWPDLKWIRDVWGGKIVVKGVHIGDDARRAIDAGADAVVVSNHGGRQLDDAAAPISILRDLQGLGPVLIDGGIRRGSDVVKALASGAHGVLVGRSVLYGLATSGEPGASEALNILVAEIDRTLALVGCPDASRLSNAFVDHE